MSSQPVEPTSAPNALTQTAIYSERPDCHTQWMSCRWQVWDIWVFRAIGAGPQTATHGLRAAKLMAKWSWCPMVFLLGWQVLQHVTLSIWVMGALILAGVVQWGVKRITRRWPVPRPFALGLCPNHLQHGPRGGFPSAHAIVMGFLVGMLACAPLLLGVWWSLFALSLLTAWARVHVGAHFVSDVVVGLCVGALLGGSIGELCRLV
jgi:undecaprenyl-diphosphatase